VVWFLPFGWPAVETALARAARVEGTLVPIHASPWRLVPEALAPHWRWLRLAACAALAGGGLALAIARRLPVELWFALAGVLYVGLWLVTGGLDRFSMVAVPAIVLLGVHDRRAALRVAAGFAAAGGLTAVAFVVGTSRLRPAGWPDPALLEAVTVALFVAQLAWELGRLAASGRRLPASASSRV
jgi:hypothetical protein